MQNGDATSSEMDVDMVDSAQPKDHLAVLRAKFGPQDSERASSVPLHPSTFTVGYIYSTEMMTHSSEELHPEQPERISHIYSVLHEHKCIAKMKHIPIRRVKRDEILLVHSEAQWNSIIMLQCEYQHQGCRNPVDRWLGTFRALHYPAVCCWNRNGELNTPS
jgi:histone deacetylase 6